MLYRPAPLHSLDDIAKALDMRPAHIIAPGNHRAAAVAMILKEEASFPHVLFIERARRTGDPWSGDLGFPGGKVEKDDSGSRNAAIRETYEEIGLDLTDSHCLGRLDDIAGEHLPVLISCFLFHIEEDPPFTLSDEVTRAFWVPLSTLCDPARHIETVVHFSGKPLTRPAIDLLGPGETVLWGITYRLVRQLLERLGESAAFQPLLGVKRGRI